MLENSFDQVVKESGAYQKLWAFHMLFLVRMDAGPGGVEITLFRNATTINGAPVIASARGSTIIEVTDQLWPTYQRVLRGGN